MKISNKTKESIKKVVASKAFSKSSLTIYLIVVLLVLTLLIINIVGFSFSWFEPKTVQGDALEYNDEVAMRVENLSVSYYYTNHKETDGTVSCDTSFSSSVAIPAGQTYYFKASIVNRDTEYGSNVSLFTTSFPASGKIISLACTYPSNTYKTFTSDVDDVWIMRNAYVKPYNKSDSNPGQIDIEWFIHNKGSGSFEFDPDTIYLTYN